MDGKPDSSDDASRAYLAPADLRQHNLPVQAALGFHRGRTEELLKRAADTIERLSRELAQLHEARDRWQEERTQFETALEEEKARAERLVGEAMLDTYKAGQALRAEAEAEAAAMRAEAEAALQPARDEARRLVADAEAECERLSAQAEQYRILAADVQRRSVEMLRNALETLGGGSGVSSRPRESS